MSAQVQWYAVATQPRHEKCVREALAERNIEPFLPLMSRVSHWKARSKRTEWPVFPGYCFVKVRPVSEAVLRTIETIPGVSGIRPVGHDEIGTIERLCMSGIVPVTHDTLQGPRVRMIRGALQGVEGTLVRTPDRTLLLVVIPSLAHLIATPINGGDSTPLDDPLYAASPLGS